MLQLLDACVNNCGKTFRLEVASREFDNEIKKVVPKWPTGPVGDKLRALIKKWSEADFKSDSQLGLMTSLYSRLKQDGVDFTTQPEPQPKVCVLIVIEYNSIVYYLIGLCIDSVYDLFHCYFGLRYLS